MVHKIRSEIVRSKMVRSKIVRSKMTESDNRPENVWDPEKKFSKISKFYFRSKINSL